MKLLLVALISVGAVILSGCNKSEAQPPIVTLGEYNQIKPGMTYQQVADVVGAKETSKVKDLDPRATDKFVCIWNNSDGSRMSVTIQADKVVSQTQVGLK